MQVELSLTRDRASLQADGSLKELFYPDLLDDHEVERYQDELRRLTDDFPQVLRASSLSTVQASLEVNLLAIARFHATSTGGAFDQDRWLSGRGRIWGVKEYLEKEHGKTAMTIYRPKINDYSNIRNAIAHGDGRITPSLKDPAATVAAAGRLDCVRIENEKIILKKAAVRDFANASKFLCFDLLRH